MSFTRFACFDWSGAAVERPPGIALAVAGADGGVALVERRWSRADALVWLCDVAASGERMLIGMDLSFGLPFADAGAYFPGWDGSPPDAGSLWALVDALGTGDPHLGAAGVLRQPDIARHFRQPGGRLGDRFGTRGGGRLRVVETRTPGAASAFNLVGAAQVGKASLTGMRLLHALRGRLPIWPFDPLPPAGPVLVELWTTITTRAVGLPPGRSKVRGADALRSALTRLGAVASPAPARLDDHATDALVGAAWLRMAGADPMLWSPPALTPALARTEGWTFGVR